MKKLLVVLLALATIFAFAACGEQTDNEADQMDTAVEIMSNPLYDLDESQYTEAEIELFEGYTVLGYYTDNEGLVDVLSCTVEKDGQTQEEYVSANAETYGGCYEFSDFYGTQLGLCCFLQDFNGEKFYVKAYNIDDGEKFIEKLFYYHTEEMQLGDSGYYFYMPKAMTKAAEDESLVDTFDDGYLASYTPTVDGLCNMDLYVIPQNSISYETEKTAWADYDFTMVTEEQFNAWLEDGLTIDEVDEYYTTLFGDYLGDHMKYTNENGIELLLKEITLDSEDGSQTEVSVLWIDENAVYEIYLISPTELWPNIGEAIANGVHTK